MIILNKPTALSLSGNLEKIRISSEVKISFILRTGEQILLSSTYSPGVDGIVTIDIRDIVESQLDFILRDITTAYVQPSLVKDFIATINAEEYTFRVIRGGVDNLSVPPANFLICNFLTWQPQIKAVTYYSPELLTYYAIEPLYLKVKAYFQETDRIVEDTKQFLAMSADTAYTIPLQYSVVASLFDSRFPSFYDVWVENIHGQRVTYVQRYFASDRLSEQEQWVLFENSLGGIDCFRAYGQCDFTGEHTHNIAEIDEIAQEYRVDVKRKFQKSTGYLDDKNRKWLLDFFPSGSKYIYLGNFLRKIVVTESNVTFTDKELPSEFKFTYHYADARPYLNLQRVEHLPENLIISVPDLASFSIPPRLVEFSWQPLSEGVLFPVQNPYSEKWSITNIGAMINYFLNRVSDEFITPIHSRFIRKDQDDSTNFLVKFFKGIHISKFVPGWIGSGAAITVDSKTGKTRLEVDEVLACDRFETMEFRFNRVDVISGETWNSFAFGKIKKVNIENQIVWVDLVDGELLTSKVNDICRGIFHKMDGVIDNEDSKDECGFYKVVGFSTSYFTPTEILEDGTGFRYALKSGTSVHPCAEMKFVAYGNFTDKSRQSSAYSTRTTEILLANVNTWEINPDRHYMFIKGLLEGITIGGVELHGYSTLQRNSYLMGTQIQFTPEQLEELKGNDAYSVSLSTYEGTVIVDSVGNIVGAMQKEHDVVSGERDVVSGDRDVVASRWRLSTRIQVFRGKTELVYGEVMREDGFTVVVHAVGCEYKLVGGVVSILKVTDIDNVRLDMEINCEGIGIFSKTYHVTALLDGNSVWATYHDSEDMPSRPTGGGTEGGWHRNLTMSSLWVSQKNSRLVTDGEWGDSVPLHGDNAYTLNLTSDTDAVPCDTDGNPLKKGILATTIAQLYIGGVRQEEGVSYSMEAAGCTIDQDKNMTGLVSVTGISEDNASVMVTALYRAKVVRKQYTLIRVKGTSVYQLNPSSDVIKRNIKGSGSTLSPGTLRCGVTRFDGSASVSVEQLPDGYALKLGTPGGALLPYTINTDINTSLYSEAGIAFSLYNEVGVMIDCEAIPVVSDGEPHFKLDLTNQQSSVTCDSKGNVVGDIQPSTAIVYAGSTIDQEWKFTAVFTGCKGNISPSGLITVTSLTADSAGVSVKATKEGFSDLMAVYTLSKVYAGADGSPAVSYWLVPSVDKIQKNKDGILIPSSVSCTAMKQVGANSPVATDEKTLKYRLSNGNETSYNGSVSIGSALWVEFILYDGNVVLDKERIPVVSDGNDGKPGDDGNPGQDAKVTWLTSSVTQLAVAGSEIIPSSFTVYCKEKEGVSGTIYNCYDYVFSVWKSNDGSYWTKDSENLFGSSITVYPTAGYSYYRICASVSPMSYFDSTFALSISVNAVKNGTDGLPGAGGISYWLSSSVTQIVRNTLGNIEPSSFTVYCKKSENGEVSDYSGMYLSVWRSNDGSNWSQAGIAVKSSSVAVTPSTSYNQYVVRAGSVAYPSWGGSYALSVSVNMVKDGINGLPGSTGATGSMPRLCGEFKSGQSYVWDSEFRDIVYKTVGGINQLFMVNTFGRTVTATPYSSTQDDADWKSSAKWQFIATDTLLADGANIAGFMYKAMKMVSQAMTGSTPNLSLDGIAGKVQVAGAGSFIIGDKGRTAYFEFDAQYNVIKLYNTAGENLMTFGISNGLSWIELKSGNYKLSMYGSSVSLTYGNRSVTISPTSCHITDGTDTATIQPSTVSVGRGNIFANIGVGSVTVRDALGDVALLETTGLTFTKSGRKYS